MSSWGQSERNRKLIAYGNNRADYTFIPGGMVPGVTILQPDIPELTDIWLFVWSVVGAATSFIFAANAAHAETKTDPPKGTITGT